MAVAAVLSPAAVDHGPDVCPFRIMTGLPCPGGGVTPRWTPPMHGDVAGAIGLNVFGPITMAVTAIAVVLAVWRLMAGPAALASLRLGRLMPYALAVVGIWLVYGVARIIDAAAGWGLFPTVV